MAIAVAGAWHDDVTFTRAQRIDCDARAQHQCALQEHGLADSVCA